jgi:hypothetical protein
MKIEIFEWINDNTNVIRNLKSKSWYPLTWWYPYYYVYSRPKYMYLEGKYLLDWTMFIFIQKLDKKLHSLTLIVNLYPKNIIYQPKTFKLFIL